MMASFYPRLFLLGVLAATSLALQTVPAAALPMAAVKPTAGQVQLSELVLVEGLKSVPRSHGEKTRTVVPFETSEAPGTIVISNADRTLHLVLGKGQAARYQISVGRDGFLWSGVSHVGRKAEWPEWRPPSAMLRRDPSLPDFVPAGPYNPLGARALYLYSSGKDTLYRIHGTNSAETIGGYETSGCFRLSNADVIELFQTVRIGAKVIVK